MPPVGLEPTHTRLKGGRSDQLSYGGHSTLVACGVRFDRFRRAGPSAALRGGTPAVAVAAAHLAAGDLGVDPLGARPVADEEGDVLRLGADVVELEHRDVRLSAVNARMRREILQHDGARSFRDPPLARRHLAPVQVAALPEVRAEA